MRNYFTLDGVDCRTMGVYISGSGTYSAPARRYNVVQVPGRNGDLVVSDNSFENATIKYPCFICDSFDTNIANFRSFLMSRNGYVSLTDSYHTSERRQVLFTGSFEPELNGKLDVASFELEFSAKPQRWLLSGDTKSTISSGGSPLRLDNPTRFPAKPTFYVYGAGQFDYTFPSSGSSGYTTNTIKILTAPPNNAPTIIDAENMSVYAILSGGIISNRASYVQMSDVHDIPASGYYTISNVTVTKVEIYPRWWTL